MLADFFPKHKDMVLFGPIECCAMHLAANNNPQIVAEYEKKVDQRLLWIIIDGFRNTSRLGFVPKMTKPIVVEIYYELAKAELARLDAQNKQGKLDCGCDFSQHIEALERIINILGNSRRQKDVRT